MKKYLKYLITLGVGLVFVFLIVLSKDVFIQDNIKDIMHILVDGFFAVGVVILCFGCLVVASNGGTFDMLVYGTQVFISMFKKDMKRKYKDFYEYRKTKQESPKEYFYFILVGIILIIISMIFLLIYYQY